MGERLEILGVGIDRIDSQQALQQIGEFIENMREVAKQEWQGTLQQNLLDIPAIVVPGDEPTMRCCIYKERAILAERIKLAWAAV